jgi:hypothetical protein
MFRCFCFVEGRDKDTSRDPIGGSSVYVAMRKIVKQIKKMNARREVLSNMAFPSKRY